MTSTSTVPLTDEAHRERRALVKDTVGRFRSVLTTFRLYNEAHDNRRIVEQELFDAMTVLVTKLGTITLFLQNDSFAWEGERVYVDQNDADSIVRPLFSDAVETITFEPGMSAASLKAFLILWHIAVSGRYTEGHSFSTDVWEANLIGIRVNVVESFSEEAGSDLEGAPKKKKRVGEEDMARIMSEMQRDAMPTPKADAGSTIVISAFDMVGMLNDEVIKAAEGELLALHDRPVTRIALLDDAEVEAIARGTKGSWEQAGERALAVVWSMLPIARPDERAHLLALVERILNMLATQSGAMPEILSSLNIIVNLARQEAARVPDLLEFLAPLAKPDVLKRLVTALDDPNEAPQAEAALRFLPAVFVQELFAMLPKLQTRSGRQLAVTLVAAKRPSKEILVEWVRNVSGDNVVTSISDILAVAELLSPEVSAHVAGTVLVHRDARVRSAMLSRATAGHLAMHEGRLLHVFAQDTSPGMRRAVLDLFVRNFNRNIIPAIAKLLAIGKVENEERRSFVRALATLGGPDAPKVLQDEFQRDVDIELKCEVALALGQGKHNDSRPLLEKEAKRLLGNKQLREACNQALALFDRKK